MLYGIHVWAYYTLRNEMGICSLQNENNEFQFLRLKAEPERYDITSFVATAQIHACRRRMKRETLSELCFQKTNSSINGASSVLFHNEIHHL